MESEQMQGRLADLVQRVERLESNRPTKAQGHPPPSIDSLSPTQTARLEGQLGRYWFSRLGILSLVTGIAFFVADGLVWLGPALKVLLGFFLAAALVALGRVTMRRQLNIGRILVAGGLGVAYYTTYAMHYVPSVHLIRSPVLALALLVLMVLLIVAVAHTMQSETVAGVALFLGLHTGMVSPIGSFTLLSGALLAAAAGFLLAKKRWIYVPVSTLLAVYGTHFLWLLGNPLLSSQANHNPDHFSLSIAFATLYFGIFHVALSWASRAISKSVTNLFARLNWACLVVLFHIEFPFHGHEGLAIALAALSILLVLSALWEGRLRGRDGAIEVHLSLAVASAMLAAWTAYSGAPLVLLWSAASIVALGAAQWLRFPSLHYIATLCLATSYLAYFNAHSLLLAAALAVATMAHERVRAHLEPPFATRASRLLYPLSVAALAVYALSLHLGQHNLVLSWLLVASGLFIIGGILGEMSYRIAALALFLLSFARLFLVDMAELASGYRILAFVGLGASLLLISYWYARRSDRIDALEAKT